MEDLEKQSKGKQINWKLDVDFIYLFCETTVNILGFGWADNFWLQAVNYVVRAIGYNMLRKQM